MATPPVEAGSVVAADGVSKAAVIERHGDDGSIGRGFVTGFGFERGASASTVAHDSHNLLAVGTSDAAMERATERVVDLDGGMVAVDGDGVLADVPLPVAGLMSDQLLSTVSAQVSDRETAWRALGCDLDSPFYDDVTGRAGGDSGPPRDQPRAGRHRRVRFHRLGER
jgi:adenine deaminase